MLSECAEKAEEDYVCNMHQKEERIKFSLPSVDRIRSIGLNRSTGNLG